jgi:hypothetical protein
VRIVGKIVIGENQFCGTGSVSQRYGSGSFFHQAIIVRKFLIPTVLRLLFDFLSLKNNLNLPFKLFDGVMKATNENTRIRTNMSRIRNKISRIRNTVVPPVPVILAEESVVHQKEIRTPEVPFEAVKNGTLETV